MPLLRPLLTLTCLLSALHSEAGIFKCQDLKTGGTLFSSEPCDPHSQRLITVLKPEELEKRLSTFDGAGLKQKEQARQRRKAQKDEPKQASSADGHHNYCIILQREKAALLERIAQPHADVEGDQWHARLRLLSERMGRYRCPDHDKLNRTVTPSPAP